VMSPTNGLGGNDNSAVLYSASQTVCKEIPYLKVETKSLDVWIRFLENSFVATSPYCPNVCDSRTCYECRDDIDRTHSVNNSKAKMGSNAERHSRRPKHVKVEDSLNETL
jgi:hypothetical protein